MSEQKIPMLHRQQVEALDALFPEQTPELDWSDRMIWYRAGQRHLIRFLWKQIEEQEENVLDNDKR